MDESLYLFPINSQVTVEDSKIEGVQCSSGSSLLMNNSIVLGLSFIENNVLESDFRGTSPPDISLAKISSSNIGRMSGTDEIRITFDYTLVNEVFMGPDTVVKGDVTYGKSTIYDEHGYEINPYESLAYTQEFRVSALGETHIIPNIELTLIDGSGETVWEGVSDENGEAFFNITFCNHYPLNEPY